MIHNIAVFFDAGKRSESHASLYLLTTLFLAVCFILFALTRNYIFKYGDMIKSQAISAILVIIQFVGSILLAILLLNYVFSKISFFTDLYESNNQWVLGSFAALFISLVMFAGFILTLCSSFIAKNTVKEVPKPQIKVNHELKF